jgi:uncharacterized membrane protein
MSHVSATIDVDRPIRTVYNQWTQFEEFPAFMSGVESVRQLDDARLHWKASIGGVSREWDARIVDQVPDRLVSWESTSGARNAGIVKFEPLGSDRTSVMLDLDFEPEGATEKVGDALGIVERRAEGDLERFKEFIEAEGWETGAWRGRIQDGRAEPDSTI